MRRSFCWVLLACLLMAAPALADWFEGDPYKMHWPQVPLWGGWDVEFGSGDGWPLGDDWTCIESGTVEDIHFWISWNMDLEQPIDMFTVFIFSNNPQGPWGWSEPDMLLWMREFSVGDFVIRYEDYFTQDWLDPSGPYYYDDTHGLWVQINITAIEDPFVQMAGDTYWLVIDFHGIPFLGWKETDLNYMDAAVWWDRADSHGARWEPVLDPAGAPVDLAFVITGMPLTSTEDSDWSVIKKLY